MLSIMEDETGTLNILANDENCPITAVQSFNYAVNVNAATYVGDDVTICGSQSAQLNASGSAPFTWTVLSGDPISVPGNFSCNPCADPQASPANTTTYVVTGGGAGAGCSNTDTVTVNVVPDFTYSTSQSLTSSCLFETISYSVSPSGPGPWQYQWDENHSWSNDTAAAASAMVMNSGTDTATVTTTPTTTTIITARIRKPDLCHD